MSVVKDVIAMLRGTLSAEDRVRDAVTDAEYRGEMVVRCPEHITGRAISNAENGREDIRQ